MDKTNGTSGPFRSPGQEPDPRAAPSASQAADYIVLPALIAPKKTASNKSAIEKSKTTCHSKSAKKRSTSQKDRRERQQGTASKPAPATTAEPGTTNKKTRERLEETEGETLPEYSSQTNGLRELLCSIEPFENLPHTPALSLDPNLTEPPMYLPHSRPGLPGSPDLPIGPTRWGLYLGGSLGAVAVLFVSALVYSHLISPTGINWSKLQARTGDMYQQIVASLATDTAPHDQKSKTAIKTTPTPIKTPTKVASLDNADTQITAAPRISTTAASPQNLPLDTPSVREIFMSPEALEAQIKAFETSEAHRAKPQLRPTKSRKSQSLAKQEVDAEFATLVIPTTSIDPDMEDQIFDRATGYLRQRDLSSARMILQYAATLGSGISAMALAQTYDPEHLKKGQFHDVNGNQGEARKWYYMASRLGIKEAGERLTALK